MPGVKKCAQEPLAIVGIGCRLPGGVVDPESFWSFLAEGRSGIIEVPSDRWTLDRFYHENPAVPGRMHTKWGGFIDNFDEFDAKFWGITPREALRMDPQQRWLLETAWEAIEDSGTAPSDLGGQSVGCFVGIATHDYGGIQGESLELTDAHTNSGITLSIASNRISYLLDLKGPSLSVDTACSSSLVALSIACRSIWAGECDAALVGGVNAMCTPHPTIGFAKASMLSPSGQCFAFDARANGYVRGEGAGMVYFKKLSQAIKDNDRIYSVIRAAVMNQDGHTSSMTVPGAEAQADMLRRAYSESGIDPRQVVYMEAHGTGTPVGDPIESSALGRVLAEGRNDGETCLVGSVKSNIGHLEAGSGIAGLIKASLVLHKDQVPPNANFETPNPNIPFEELKLRVATELQPLPRCDDQVPVTAVNSFGFGGTNSHAVLEAAPLPNVPNPNGTDGQARADRPCLLPISARDSEALRSYVRSYVDYLGDPERDLSEVGYAAGERKEHHDERLVFLGANAHQMREQMESWLENEEKSEGEEHTELNGVHAGRKSGEPKPAVFVFTGQGAQWWAMGQQLLQREPIFRRTLEKIDSILSSYGDFSLVEEMSRDEEESRINDTNIAQPAIFGLQVALAELWKSWGVEPSKVVGHSVGEVAAAYVAGIYSLEDSVKIIYQRSRLQNRTQGEGRMIAVGVSSREARELIGDHQQEVQIAAVNSSNLVTIAGETEPLEQIAEQLESNGTFHKWLPVDYPFHTHKMDSIKDELLQVLADIQPQAARIPFVSTVTGGVFQSEDMDASYWWANVRNPVLFAPAIRNIARGGDELYLELGPHPALRNPINECLAAEGTSGTVLHSLKRKTDETQQLFSNVSALHHYGYQLNWQAINQARGEFVRLPRYPWNRERFWLETTDAKSGRVEPDTHPLLGRRLQSSQPTWEFKMDPRVFTYLESHRFWGSILFPAAGYGEISLALARAVFPDKTYSVEDMVVRKALFLSEEAVPTVRITYNEKDKTYTITSSTDMVEWDLHVEGRLTHYQSDAPDETLDLDSLIDRLPQHTGHIQYYEELDAAGFHFGPHFKLVKNVWHGPGEALIEVPVPNSDEVNCEPGHHFHPILLDACLQVGKAAMDAPEYSDATQNLYLPRRLGRVRLYREEIPPRFWAYGRQTKYTDDMISFDIVVCDDEGNRVADILDFRTEPMDHIRDDSDVESNLYAYRWEKEELEQESEPTDGTTSSSAKLLDDELSGKSIIVFRDAGGVLDDFCNRLVAKGASVVSLLPGEAFQDHGDGSLTVDVVSEAELKKVVSRLDAIDHIVHGWSLDHSDDAELDDVRLSNDKKLGILSALKLCHALAELDVSTSVLVVTRDAQAVTDSDLVSRPLSAAINGFVRVAFNENPQVSWRTVDLAVASETSEGTQLISELCKDGSEPEVAYRNGERYLKRLHRVRASEFPLRLKNAIQPDGSVTPYQLQIETPGILSNLSLDETVRREPGPGEIEASVVAAGINFRNVMKALGMPIGNTMAFPGYGEDFSGTVLRVGPGVDHLKPGDHILGMGAGTFRGFVTTDARAVFKKPDRISFSDAATIPTVFSTAFYALKWLARMQPGESVLIHAGTGGVGQAAIQIAKEMGLKILATAGTPEKRQLLLELGADHAMPSRTLDFVDDVMRITDGKGVDCVLNSLAGDFIQKSLAVLAPFGRFVEIGKVDIHNNSNIGMELFKNNISYFMFDLIEYIVQRTDHIAEMFTELGEKFEQGIYNPLTHTDFPITKVEEAYRYMAQGKHVGKNVLTFDVDEIMIAPSNESGNLFRENGSYLITGGAAGFGLKVAEWMAKHGAGHLVLMSRSGPRDDESLQAFEKIREYGATISDARGDVTNLDDVRRVVQEVSAQGQPPLLGVIHGAMVLRDEFIADLDDDLFTTVTRPKINGAWNLHLATKDLELEHFICFSSFSAVIGAPKQSNYNSGNVYLEALAQHRRRRGLPALTINWGALSGAGFVARNEKTAAYLDAIGMKALHVDEAMKVIRRMLRHDTPQVLASRADWNLWSRIIGHVGNANTFEAVTRDQGDDKSAGAIGPRILAASPETRSRLVEDFIAENMAAVCSIDAEGIDRHTPLTSLGLDSLMAVELMNRIEGDIGLSVPMGKVLAGPSICELAEIIIEMLAGGADGEDADATDSKSVGASLAPIEVSERPLTFELTSAQQRLLTEHLVAPHSSSNIVHFVCNVTPAGSTAEGVALDIDCLQQAMEEVGKAHPMLRSRINCDSWEQTIGGDIAWEVHNADGHSPEAIDQFVSQRALRPFDLATESPTRLEVVRTNTQGDILIFAAHAIVCDQRSVAIVMDHLFAAYADAAGGRLATIERPLYRFQDFTAWEQSFLASDSARVTFEAMRDRLDGAPAILQLADQVPATSSTIDSVAAIPFEIDCATSQKLLGLAAKQETTLYKTILATFECVLHSMSGQNDLLIECRLPGRKHAELLDVVGPLGNRAAVRSQCLEDRRFSDHLDSTSVAVEAAIGQQHFPLDGTFARMEVPEQDGRTPGVQVLFEMELDSSLDPRSLPSFLIGHAGHKFVENGLVVRSTNVESRIRRSDLALSLEEAGGRIRGVWRYNPGAISEQRMNQIKGCFDSLVATVVENPLQRLSELNFDGGRPFADWGSVDETLCLGRLADDVDPALESQLDEEISNANLDYDFHKCDRVFLTGATGFVGAHLIQSLLRETTANIVCLVRADDAAHGLERIVANLEKYDIDAGSCIDRLSAVPGDLTKPMFGLSPSAFESLAAEIDVVYHNGADVNLAADYASLKAVNVNGSREALRLGMTHHVKPTHMVTSYAVHASNSYSPNSVISEKDPLPEFGTLQNGYAKTKWIVEQMVMQARERGLPVTIYRPGNITGHSETGLANTADIMHTLMLGILHVGSIPASDIKIDLTPVNYVADGIVNLSRRQDCLGGTFNLLNKVPLNLRLMAEWLSATDPSVNIVTLKEWRQSLMGLAGSVPAEVLGILAEIMSDGDGDDEFIPPAFLTTFDCSQTEATLAESGIRCHPVDRELLDCYQSKLQATGFFDLIGA